MKTTGLDKNFKRFLVIWLGETIASIGSGLTAFGLSVYAYQITNMASSVSIITLCSFLPSVLLAPIAGALADRFDRRLLMVLGDGLSAIGLVALLIIMYTGNAKIWQICVCVAFSSIFVSLIDPAYRATVSDLLSEEQFAKAGGLVQLASSAKYLFSPIIAGFLLLRTDVKTLMIIDISTLLFTVICILIVKSTIETNKTSEENIKDNLIGGCKFLWSNKGVLLLMILVSVITYFMGFIETLFTPMMLSFSDAKTLGCIQSFGAIGMIISSLVISIWGMGNKDLRNIKLGLIVSGIFIALLGVTTNIIILAIVTFVFYAALPPVNAGIEVLMRKSIPNETQGRVWGLLGMISQVGYIIAYIVSGPLADYIFNPLLCKGGILSSSVGRLIGVGPARGIGLLFLISGILIILISCMISRVKSIRKLENKHVEQEGESICGYL